MPDLKTLVQVVRTKLNHAFRIPLSLLTILIFAILILAFSDIGISFMWAMFTLIALVVVFTLLAFWYCLIKNHSLLRSEEHIAEMQKLGSSNPVYNPKAIEVSAREIEKQLVIGTPSLPPPQKE